MAATTSATRSLKRPLEASEHAPFADEVALRYTKLPAFTAMGQADVLLRLEDGGKLPAHSEMLRVYSGVLRDVSRSTLLCSDRGTGLASSHDVADAEIPLGDGIMLSWGQTLAALYSFKDGATDEDTWDAIPVRQITISAKDNNLRPVVTSDGGQVEVTLRRSVTFEKQ